MREEFRQPIEFHIASEYYWEKPVRKLHVASEEFHAPSGEFRALPGEYYAPSGEFHALPGEYDTSKEERSIGPNDPAKPPKGASLAKVRKMLYVASATVFVTVATQAVYPDFVVFSDPFSSGQECGASTELPPQEEIMSIPSPEEDTPSKPTDPGSASLTDSAGEEGVESGESSDSQGSSAIWTDCTNCEDGLVVCPVCNGDWEHGAVEVLELDCEHCENGIIQKSHSIYIYNGTPCKFCNDAGTFLDANGEMEECGECRGYASRHQVGEKQIFEYYNEFYRVYAFDESVEYEEVECPVCGGRGVISESVEVPCRDCNHGFVVCPVCEGDAGWLLHERLP